MRTPCWGFEKLLSRDLNGDETLCGLRIEREWKSLGVVEHSEVQIRYGSEMGEDSEKEADGVGVDQGARG